MGRGGLAGPLDGHRPAERLLIAIRRWGARHGDRPERPLDLSATEFRAARTIRRAMEGTDTLRSMHGLATAVYIALWTLTRKDAAWAYLRTRSAQRRWRPSDGAEWDHLRLAASWPQAWVVARLYLNGLPGNARLRSREDAPAQRCWHCGAEGPLLWKWLLPSIDAVGGQQAVGWCAGCVGLRDSAECFLHSNDTVRLGDLPGPCLPRQGRQDERMGAERE